MNILVIGKNGQLGKSIQKILINFSKNENIKNDKFYFVGRDELDLEKEHNINFFFNKNSFDIIINCAAYTLVDKAETEFKVADRVNNIAIKHIARIAKNTKAKLIHFSTDYVFDGFNTEPYTESDHTNPINNYGKTKLAGEQAILKMMKTNAIIIRVSWIFSEYGNNFLKTMLNISKKRNLIRVVDDQISSPTYASDLAEVVLSIVGSNKFREHEEISGLYHYSNIGEASWYEFAKEIFKIKKVNCIVEPIKTNEFPSLANRPKNTLLSKEKFAKELGYELYHWKSSLKNCLSKIDL